MAGTKLGMTPIEYPVAGSWTAWIPLLENDKYGLMMVYCPGRQKDRRNFVLREEFDTPQAAHEFARKWYRNYSKTGAVNPPRTERILLMREQGHTLQEIADELNLGSRQRVHQIIHGKSTTTGDKSP